MAGGIFFVVHCADKTDSGDGGTRVVRLGPTFVADYGATCGAEEKIACFVVMGANGSTWVRSTAAGPLRIVMGGPLGTDRRYTSLCLLASMGSGTAATVGGGRRAFSAVAA